MYLLVIAIVSFSIIATSETMSILEAFPDFVEYQNEVTQRFEELETKIQDAKTELRTDLTGQAIGFYASHRNDLQRTIIEQHYFEPPEILTYDDVKTNIGFGYSAATGKFTAPIKGMYFFTTTIMTQGCYTRLEIKKNNDIVGRVYADGSQETHDQSTHALVLDLQANDYVYVTMHHTGGIGYYLQGGLYSSFSGFLIE